MKINVTNKEKIQEALDEVQGKCKERCYSPVDIEGIAKKFIERLSKAGVPRGKMVGCSVEFGGGYIPAKSYKYPFMGTIGVIRLSTESAFLTAVYRGRCNYRTKAVLTEDAKNAMARHFEDSQIF